jgi:hypothetical protein
MVTHEPVVGVYAQDVAVIRDGKIVDHFPTDGMTGHELSAKYSECVG